MENFREFFSQLFTQLSSADSWTVISMLIGAFLIGLITHYFMTRGRIRKLQDELEAAIRAKKVLEAQVTSLKDQQGLLSADLKKANLELASTSKKLSAAHSENSKISSRLTATLTDFDKIKLENQEANNRIEELNDQILGLRTKNAQLSSDLEQSASESISFADGVDTDVSKEIINLKAENDLLKNSLEEFRSGSTTEGTTEATLKITELENENEQLRLQIETLSAAAKDSTQEEVETDLEAVHPDIIQLESGNEILQQTIQNLLLENGALRNRLNELPQLEAGNEVLNHSIQQLIAENEELQNSSEELVQYQAGQEALQATIADLLANNDRLEEQLKTFSDNSSTTPTISPMIDEQEEAAFGAEVPEEMDLTSATTNIRAAIGERITTAQTDEKDDLKVIDGIGPFMEEKLNSLGIYTYQQLSELDDEMVQSLTVALEYIPGRIEMDDWVGQADRLRFTTQNQPTPMSATTSAMATSRYATATEKIVVPPVATPEQKDDLKKIEGIGPKIEQLLNDAGILSFAALSGASTEQLNEILENAGNRYRMHDPTTWPQQAMLAANGEWEKLQILQDRLDGGRKVS